MKKIYKKLTSEQIERGVIFSSCFSNETTEQTGDNIHEVFKTEEDLERVTKIQRLKNIKFFRGCDCWKYCIERS